MEPATIDITIRQGKTFRKRFWYGRKVDPNGPDPDPTTEPPTNFDPHDLTGCVARMQVRPTAESEVVLIDLDDTTITVGDAEGWVRVEATADQTAGFDFDLVADPLPAVIKSVHGSGVYELEIEWLNGDVDALAEGAVTFKPEVTR